VEWDQLDITGTLDFDNASVPSGVTIKPITLNNTGNPGQLTGFNQSINYSWQIADADTIAGFSTNHFAIDSTMFANTFGGMFTVSRGGANNAKLFLNYVAGPTSFVADSYTRLRGFYVSGALADTFASDNMYLVHNPGITLNPSEPPVWLEFIGTSPTQTPTFLNVKLEAKVNTLGLQQRIEMFNWTTNQYELVDARAASLNVDGIVSVNVAIASDFVQAGTRRVKARLGWKQTGLVFLFPWTVSVDQVVWLLV
jgi:hypothetical protein